MERELYVPEVGGVSSSLDLPPNQEIDSDYACVCVACVLAKLRERDDLAAARGGRTHDGQVCHPPAHPRSRGTSR